MTIKSQALAILIFINFIFISCTPVDEIINQSLNPSQDNKKLEEFNLFEEVSFKVGHSVDRYYSAHQELLIQRSFHDSDPSDFSEPKLKNQENFVDRIAYFVFQHTNNNRPKIAQLSSFYNVPSQIKDHIDISFKTHKLCPTSAQSLSKTIGPSRVPNSNVIDKINRFNNQHNNLRKKFLNDNKNAEAKTSFNKLWTRFMSCLAYTESLTTADIKSSDSVADKYSPTDYNRPEGVKFYEDPYQSSKSRLNIGLYQFTPNSNGNVAPCIREWNQIYPEATISLQASQPELIKVLGSSFQTFNAFCGVNKILQTFSVQINTSDTQSTHPENTTSGLKKPNKRCVTPFFYSNWAYNHFGPLMNSTGSNLGKFMSCVVDEL